MKKAVRGIILAITTLCLLFAVACDNNDGGTTPETPESVALRITGAVSSLNVGESATLGVTITPAGTTGEVVWSSSDASVASVTNNVLSAHKAGNARITATLKDKDASDSFLLAVTAGGGLNPATAVAITGVPTEKLYSDDVPFRLTATLTAQGEGDCTDTVKWTSSNPSVLTVDHKGEVTILGSGTATVRAAVVDNISLYAEEEIRIYPESMREDGKGGVIERDTFASAEIVENWCESELFYIGTRTNSTTHVAPRVGEDGVVWSPAINKDSNQRIMFQYRNYSLLDFTGNKQYVLRVALRTPEDFPNVGYIFVYGFKQEACDSYKNPNPTGDLTITSKGGSTGRKVIAGKNEVNYLDYILDGTQSSEFWLAVHGASNASKPGMNVADITVESISVIDLAAYNEQVAAGEGDITETFETATIETPVGTTKFTGEYFTFTTTAADLMEIVDFPAPALSMFAQGKSLHWVTPRVYQKGLQQNTEGESVSHPKMIIDYTGKVDAAKAYHVRLPLFIEQTNVSAEKLSIEFYYVPTGDYKEISLGVKTAGYNLTVPVFEADIPADWSGQLVVRLFHEDVTAKANNSKFHVYIDGISVAVIESEGQN